MGQGIYNHGAYIKIAEGAVVKSSGARGGYTATEGTAGDGLVMLSGRLEINGNLTSNNSDGRLFMSASAPGGRFVFSDPYTCLLKGTSELFIFNNLEIRNGATLLIQPTQEVTVNGNLQLGHPQCLVSLASLSGMGSLITYGSIVSSSGGSARFERWMRTNGTSRWEYFSSPVAVFSSATLTSPPRSLWYANEPTNSWVAIPHSLPQNLALMKGYGRKYVAAEGDGDQAKSFTGIPNTGMQDISLSRTETAPGTAHGWNLVGNPYPSNVDWDASTGWLKVNVLNAIYFRTNGNYASYVAGVGTNGGKRYIPSMQAFWVRVVPGQTTGLLGCDNPARLHNESNIYKSYPSLDNNLRIIVNNLQNGYTDETYVRFGAYASYAFDAEYDAFKMFAADSVYPQVYTHLQGIEDISINSLGDLSGEYVLPLGFKTLKSGTFEFTAELVESFSAAGNSVYLEDLLTGHSQDLASSATYQFYSGVTNSYGRFLLHFNPVMVEIDENTSEAGGQIRIFAWKNEVFISSSGDPLNGNLRVYDLAGRLVAERSFADVQSGSLIVSNASGIYIVRFAGSSNNLVQRVNLIR